MAVDGDAFGVDCVALRLRHGRLVQIVTCSCDVRLRNVGGLMQRLLVTGSRHRSSDSRGNHDGLMKLLRLVTLNYSRIGYRYPLCSNVLLLSVKLLRLLRNMLWLLRDMLRLLRDMLWLLRDMLWLLLLRGKVLLLKLSMGLLHLLLVVKLLLLGIVELLLLLLVVQLLLLNVWVASLSHGRWVWNTLVLHALLRMWLVLRMTALLRVVLGCLPVVLLLGWRGTAVVLRRLQLVGMVPVGAVTLLLHVVHLLHLELTLVLLVCPQFFLRVDLLLVQALPAIVPLEVLPLRHVHELLVADHAVLVLVTLVNDVLSHALNLLLPLPGIVFLIVGVIDFLHLGSQDGFDLVLIQLAVPVQIVHGKEGVGIEILLVHVVLFLPSLLQLRLASRFVHGRVVLVLLLELLVVLLLLLPLLLRHVFQLVTVLQLLLHLVLLELLLSLLVQLLQVLGRRHNQLLQVINLEAVGILIVDMKGHLHLIPIQAKLLSLHGFHGQPT